jgi:hypothetical protein
MGRRLQRIGKGPLATAAILCAPLFFCSLMGSSLAIARPQHFAWTHAGKHISVYRGPTDSEELRIWLWALVPVAILLAIGLLACLWRYGAFISCAAGIVVFLAVTHRLSTWERHHTERWPRGIDNIPDKWSGDTAPRGSWEHDAADAARSLSHWGIGLAVSVAAVYGLVLYRRQRNRARIALIETAQESATTPAA